MFQSNHVLQCIWNVEFSPVKDGNKLSGGGGKVRDEGFRLKVSVIPIACLEEVIFSVR